MSEDLIPADLERCQTEITEGSFVTFGGKRETKRCKNKPVVVVMETQPGKDGKCGSMSLCEHCKKVFCEQELPKLGGRIEFIPIEKAKENAK